MKKCGNCGAVTMDDTKTECGVCTSPVLYHYEWPRPQFDDHSRAENIDLNRPLLPKTRHLNTLLMAALDKDNSLVGHPMPVTEGAIYELSRIGDLIEAFRKAKMVMAAPGSPDWMRAQAELSHVIAEVCNDNGTEMLVGYQGSTGPMWYRVSSSGLGVLYRQNEDESFTRYDGRDDPEAPLHVPAGAPMRDLKGSLVETRNAIREGR